QRVLAVIAGLGALGGQDQDVATLEGAIGSTAAVGAQVLDKVAVEFVKAAAHTRVHTAAGEDLFGLELVAAIGALDVLSPAEVGIEGSGFLIRFQGQGAAAGGGRTHIGAELEPQVASRVEDASDRVATRTVVAAVDLDVEGQRVGVQGSS